MAVPKKKTSKSKSGMRKGGNGSYKNDFPQLVIDKETGEPRLNHHMSASGMYKGRQVVVKKEKVKVEKTPKE